MKIKVRKNEIDPRELNRLLESGAKVIRKYEYQSFGVSLLGFVSFENRKFLSDGKIYTTDNIQINNRVYNLALEKTEYFNEVSEML